ncbi:MAG TPA: glycosyltransferase family 9 protein [Nitrospirae bacterium]|nr:glycosyltransferase family 9 protein [Nitrospirota bacterium]
MTEQKIRKVAYDCQYYIGDRPCIWHKRTGVICECEHYTPLKESLLIIKLDAIGDVLRTTCLLPVIAKAWLGTRITWITREESVSLLENNPHITEVVPYNTDALVHLSSRTFDRVINLDAGKISAGMAAIAKAKEKIGYILHEDGYVVSTNAAAENWLHKGIFDDLKKENQISHQDIMCSILGLPSTELKYVFELTETEKEMGQNHLEELGLDLNKNIIGIHTGGGGRWQLKQWQEEKFIELISELIGEIGNDAQILLVGGPLERELNKRIMSNVNAFIFDTGCDNGIRHFASLINCCSVVLSSDSLAMHIALALSRRTVVLFGPTSSAEIKMFGLGEKVVPDLDCLVCYKRSCDFNPNCMDLISVDMVKQAIFRQLNIASTIKSKANLPDVKK